MALGSPAGGGAANTLGTVEYLVLCIYIYIHMYTSDIDIHRYM